MCVLARLVSCIDLIHAFSHLFIIFFNAESELRLIFNRDDTFV